MNSNMMSRQSGLVLVIAMVALVVMTLTGLATMSDVTTQSITVRNEQFRQRAFYGAVSEVNAQIRQVNGNASSDSDPLVDALLTSSISDQKQLALGTSTDPLLTNPETINLQNVTVSARKARNVPCPGESIGTVRVLSGHIDVTAQLVNSGIRSRQQQRFVYCWP